MRVTATAPGYYGEKVREIGEEFDILSDACLGSWMKPVTDAGAAIKPPRKSAPKRKSQGEGA